MAGTGTPSSPYCRDGVARTGQFNVYPINSRGWRSLYLVQQYAYLHVQDTSFNFLNRIGSKLSSFQHHTTLLIFHAPNEIVIAPNIAIQVRRVVYVKRFKRRPFRCMSSRARAHRGYGNSRISTSCVWSLLIYVLNTQPVRSFRRLWTYLHVVIMNGVARQSRFFYQSYVSFI